MLKTQITTWYICIENDKDVKNPFDKAKNDKHANWAFNMLEITCKKPK